MFSGRKMPPVTIEAVMLFYLCCVDGDITFLPRPPQTHANSKMLNEIHGLSLPSAFAPAWELPGTEWTLYLLAFFSTKSLNILEILNGSTNI